MRGLHGRLLRCGGAARLQLALTVLLGLAGTVLIVAQATLLALVIAGAFIDGDPPGELATPLLLLAGIAVARGLVGFGFEWTGRLGAVRVMSELRRRLVDRLLYDRPGDPSRQGGAIAAAGVQGVEALEAYYARFMPQVVLAALAPLVILVWILPRDWEAAAILAVTFPLIPVFMVLIGKLAERSVRKRWQTLSELSARFVDIVAGLATLRAYGRAEAQERAIGDGSERYRIETMATLRVAFLSALVLELVAMLGTAVVAATVGVQLASGSLQLEQGLAVLLLAPELYAPLRQVGVQFHASTDGLAAAETIFEALDAGPTVQRPGAGEGPSKAEAGRQPIELAGVGFSYPGRPQAVLRDVSLELAPGERVALTGVNGSGKTTLAALLLRLADPTEGAVRCGGIDLRSIDPRAWRRQVAWIPQRPTIFSATVAANVALHDPDASRAKVAAALDAAGASSFVAVLPEQAETIVGEGGRRLSSGQAQRIALARAFLRDPGLVILDEPTTHLDPETANAVGAAVERLLAGRTALVIAHRPELIDSADRVLELAEGRLLDPPARRERLVLA